MLCEHVIKLGLFLFWGLGGIETWIDPNDLPSPEALFQAARCTCQPCTCKDGKCACPKCRCDACPGLAAAGPLHGMPAPCPVGISVTPVLGPVPPYGPFCGAGCAPGCGPAVHDHVIHIPGPGMFCPPMPPAFPTAARQAGPTAHPGKQYRVELCLPGSLFGQKGDECRQVVVVNEGQEATLTQEDRKGRSVQGIRALMVKVSPRGKGSALFQIDLATSREHGAEGRVGYRACAEACSTVRSIPLDEPVDVELPCATPTADPRCVGVKVCEIKEGNAARPTIPAPTPVCPPADYRAPVLTGCPPFPGPVMPCAYPAWGTSGQQAPATAHEGPQGAEQLTVPPVEVAPAPAGKVKVTAGKHKVHVSGPTWKAVADRCTLSEDGRRMALKGHVRLTCPTLCGGEPQSCRSATLTLEDGKLIDAHLHYSVQEPTAQRSE